MSLYAHPSKAMHSIEINIPPGNGIVCGALLAGALSGKKLLYTLLIILKSLSHPVTMKIVVLTILLMLLPASSKIILTFLNDCIACSSKLSLMSLPVDELMPAVPERKIKLPATTAWGNTKFVRSTLSVLKFFLISILVKFHSISGKTFIISILDIIYATA